MAYVAVVLEHKHILNDLVKSGIKINAINKIRFLNTEGQGPCLTEIFPTVVGVESCKDPSNVVYRFGYDAVKTARIDTTNA